MPLVDLSSHLGSEQPFSRHRHWTFVPNGRCQRLAMAAFLGLAAAVLTASRARAEESSCLECHIDPDLTTMHGDKEVSLFVDPTVLSASIHDGFACEDCHEGINPDDIPHADPIPRVNCLECHSDLGEAHRFHPQIGVAEAMSQDRAIDCVGCHGTHAIREVRDPEFAFAAGKQTTGCGTCHEAEKTAFLNSAHFGSDAAPYPDCISCHQTDVVDGNADRLAIKQAQLELCLSCHVDTPEAAKRTRLGGKFVASWGSSIHGRALEAGHAEAANCVDCHGSHEMKRGMLADSRVNKLHIPDTCRTCHAKEADAFAKGAHAAALARGVMESPVCTDCHGEHLILSTDDPRSPVEARNVSQQLCGDCHGSVKLSRKYGISSNRFRTFSDSFHGLAMRGGSVEVVNCASCHGYHDILRSDDPNSPINKANLAKTCGNCHPGANELFAVGSVHVSLAPTAATDAGGEPVVQLIATIYVWLIVLVVGAMFFHNGLDFFKKLRGKVKGHVHGVAEEAVPHRLYLRMTVNERLQHGFLVFSFVLLVVTGFMLRFPEAWWVVWLRDLNSHLFEWRSWIHRAAAVLMIAAGFWHLFYVCFTSRGRALLRDLLPRLTDISDAIGVFRYNCGLSKTKPRFKRFSYIEKTEYWALIWGSILMSVTGVLLWADDTTMSMLTKLGFDISRTVHFYEAILATLAIIVWHFYAVIFNPDVYPMNLSWLTGRLSEEEMLAEHPLELERLQKADTEDADSTASEETGESRDSQP